MPDPIQKVDLELFEAVCRRCGDSSGLLPSRTERDTWQANHRCQKGN